MIRDAIETSLWQNSVSVYRLNPERVRLDSTTASGYHTLDDEGIMQMGYNPQNNNLPQVKVMVGSVDVGVNGHLIATEVVSGQKADDPLYVPVIERLRHTLKESGLLYMGDSKMGALATQSDKLMAIFISSLLLRSEKSSNSFLIALRISSLMNRWRR
jgi:transposase